MRLDAKTIGDLRKNLRKEREVIKRISVQSTKEATNGLKKELRTDVVGAGFGTRLSNTWRSKLYDDSKGPEVDVKGFIYSRAPEIIESFDQGVVVRPKNGGRYLAIPTKNIPRHISRGKGKKRANITPKLYRERKGELSLIKSKKGHLFLIAQRQATYSKKTGEFRGLRKPSKRSLETGNNLVSTVMFILIPQAKMPKKLDVDKIADLWSAKHIDLMIKKYK